MNRKHIALLALTGAASFGLATCNDRYGYGGASVGYGTGYYSGYTPYWGWYGDYYYPGTGIYVYDRSRRAHRWNDDQRHYWQSRGDAYRNGHPGGATHARPTHVQPNWQHFGSRAGGVHPSATRPNAGRPHASPSGGGRSTGGHQRGGGHAGADHGRHDPRE